MKYSIGIDISKAKFDVCVFDGEKELFEREFKYDEKGIAKFFEIINNYSDCRITMEATGNYYVKLAMMLHSVGVCVCVVNPEIIKNYIKMKMSRVKTDKADAKRIAWYGYSEKPRNYQPESELQKNIRKNAELINDLIKTRTEFKNRLHALDNEYYTLETSRVVITELIEELDYRIKNLEKVNRELIKKTYPVKCEKAVAIPGVGERLISVLFGFLYGFENFDNAKQVSAYIGINPCPKQSGSSVHGVGSISRKGNKYVRSIFYMAALSACRFNKQCNVFYQRLLSKGKPKKVAITATANKLLKQIFAIVKHERDYNEDYNLLKKL